MTDNEQVLDAEQWKVEAQAIIEDVKHHLRDIQVSDKLKSTNTGIFLNLTTGEGSKYCVQVTKMGFKIVGMNYDSLEKINDNFNFETMSSLLDSMSPEYRQSFGNSLIDKLNKINNND
ncbi:GSK3-beta interaction protein, partial [Aphidius gifuensis]|uniref:GSK3-beta interaction protein n=1 Tax=Aphidius gifuensis TaxID=684658 RepID=UPI001CDC362C